MNVADTLEALRNKAMHDPSLKKALLETRNHPNSLGEFCRISTEAGLPIYDMDIIEYGEFAYASIRRSTNGGCMSWSRAEMPERNFGGRFFFTCVECTGMI